MITNKEKRDIWRIPENNYVDVTYLIKEKRVNEIMTNYINNNSTKKKKKNLVLYKKINIKNNINTNANNDVDISCNSNKVDINNTNYSSNNKNINKTNTSYSMKIKNIFNLKFNTSNDTSIGFGIKKLEINKKDSFFKSVLKKISCDYHEGN